VRDLVIIFSGERGKTEQKLRFGIVGSATVLSLQCSGFCTFPQLNKEPKVIFSAQMKAKASPQTIVYKHFIQATKVYEYGPLLSGRARDGYQELKHPEHFEKLHIQNSGLLLAHVDFMFQKDTTQSCYLLSPPTMTLKPGESQDLTVWAYPKIVGVFDDAVVGLVKVEKNYVHRLTFSGLSRSFGSANKLCRFTSSNRS
jgi:hydrocephalus-inducing protein